MTSFSPAFVRDGDSYYEGDLLSELPVQVLHRLETRPLAPEVVHYCPLPGPKELHPVVTAVCVPHAEDGDSPVLPDLLDTGVAGRAPAHNAKVGGGTGLGHLEIKS